jgi:hypothetical protein
MPAENQSQGPSLGKVIHLQWIARTGNEQVKHLNLTQANFLAETMQAPVCALAFLTACLARNRSF